MKNIILWVALAGFAGALTVQAGEKKGCDSCCKKEKSVVLLPPKQVK